MVAMNYASLAYARTTCAEYGERRRALSESLPGPPGTMAIIFSAPKTFYGGYTAVPQPFRQRADMYYLSGEAFERGQTDR